MEIILPIIAFIVGIIIYFFSEKSKNERIEAVKAVATRMNFSFSPQKDLEFIKRLQHFYLFSQGYPDKCTNVMQKTVNDIDVTIMDYDYRVQRAKNSPTCGQTVIVYDSPTLQLPSFTLRPKVVVAGFLRADIQYSTEKSRELDFSSYPGFSDQYALQGSPEDEIRGLFNKTVLSYYIHSGIATEGKGKQLLLYRPSERIAPEEIHSFMEQGLQIVELFYAAQQEWTEVLQRLEEKKKHPGPLAPLIADLANEDWSKRFTARHTLAAVGGEAVEPLMALVKDENPSLRETAVWVLKRVAENTTTRLARNAPHLLCPRCLVHFCAHRVNLSWWQGASSYYGCRACRQSREFFDWRGKIVAVLDSRMDAEHVQQSGTLRVNWLMRQSLFDFDEVEIIRATDEDVERLVCQVINDTDEFRRPRYKDMTCRISVDCELFENSLRILENTFRITLISN